ncbi:hypothetical protein ACFS2C_13645 [Prauserella oleivorans]|uniref:Uncharacterized protein n=1 Tax=Prauserella oleivorans TaxID=1478153 RepID=A0ABW5W933_9PSEU
MSTSKPGVDYTPPPEHSDLYTPLSREQLDIIQAVLINEDDALHASVLIAAASYPEVVHSPADNTEEDLTGVATIRALRQPAHIHLDAALWRINRAVNSETEPCYQRQLAGHEDGTAALRAIGLHLLEVGFAVAEEGDVDCTDVEAAISKAYGLPSHAPCVEHGGQHCESCEVPWPCTHVRPAP